MPEEPDNNFEWAETPPWFDIPEKSWYEEAGTLAEEQFLSALHVVHEIFPMGIDEESPSRVPSELSLHTSLTAILTYAKENQEPLGLVKARIFKALECYDRTDRYNPFSEKLARLFT